MSYERSGPWGKKKLYRSTYDKWRSSWFLHCNSAFERVSQFSIELKYSCRDVLLNEYTSSWVWKSYFFYDVTFPRYPSSSCHWNIMNTILRTWYVTLNLDKRWKQFLEFPILKKSFRLWDVTNSCDSLIWKSLEHPTFDFFKWVFRCRILSKYDTPPIYLDSCLAILCIFFLIDSECDDEVRKSDLPPSLIQEISSWLDSIRILLGSSRAFPYYHEHHIRCCEQWRWKITRPFRDLSYYRRRSWSLNKKSVLLFFLNI